MSKLSDALERTASTFKWMIRHRGISGVFRWLTRGISYHLWLYLTPGGRRELRFDQLHGIATDGVTQVSQSSRLSDSIPYEPSRPSAFFELISRLPIDHSRFTFIDIGTGKGRPLLMALHFPFRRIIGVEAFPELAAVARENTAGHGSRIEVICADAAECELPQEDLVIYMYNPFGYVTFRKFLTTVERSFRDRARQIYIVYYMPACADLIAASAWLEEVVSSTDLFLVCRVRQNATARS